MLKTPATTYKVFLFERVKKKTLFLNTETYPLQIRLTAGTKTIYLKSHFFSLLQLKKYQQDMQENSAAFILNEIMHLEEELIRYLLLQQRALSTLGSIRNEYTFLSYDILHQLDECFKQFLVDFFYTEHLPAYAMFIKNDGASHRSEFILTNLEQSLQPAVFEKLLAMAAETAPPYIPLIRFYRHHINQPVPVLPVYRWKKENLATTLNHFTEKYFPEYKTMAPAQYINQLIEKIKPAEDLLKEP
jgi:hypothetical protein